MTTALIDNEQTFVNLTNDQVLLVTGGYYSDGLSSTEVNCPKRENIFSRQNVQISTKEQTSN